MIEMTIYTPVKFCSGLNVINYNRSYFSGWRQGFYILFCVTVSAAMSSLVSKLSLSLNNTVSIQPQNTSVYERKCQRCLVSK